jgi:hypothetical protein
MAEINRFALDVTCALPGQVTSRLKVGLPVLCASPDSAPVQDARLRPWRSTTVSAATQCWRRPKLSLLATAGLVLRKSADFLALLRFSAHAA